MAGAAQPRQLIDTGGVGVPAIETLPSITASRCQEAPKTLCNVTRLTSYIVINLPRWPRVRLSNMATEQINQHLHDAATQQATRELEALLATGDHTVGGAGVSEQLAEEARRELAEGKTAEQIEKEVDDMSAEEVAREVATFEEAAAGGGHVGGEEPPSAVTYGHLGGGQPADKVGDAPPPPEEEPPVPPAAAAATEPEAADAGVGQEAPVQVPEEEGVPQETAPDEGLKEGVKAGESQPVTEAGKAGQGEAEGGEEEVPATEEEQVEKMEEVAAPEGQATVAEEAPVEAEAAAEAAEEEGAQAAEAEEGGPEGGAGEGAEEEAPEEAEEEAKQEAKPQADEAAAAATPVAAEGEGKGAGAKRKRGGKSAAAEQEEAEESDEKEEGTQRKGGRGGGKRAKKEAGGGAKASDSYLEAVEKIPAGQTRTYTEVAVAAGRPNGARSVGKAIKGLDHKTSQVPWHRVVGQDGKLQDGPSGALQLQRLQDEGARPKQGESVSDWAKRQKVHVVGTYSFAAERFIFTDLDDGRLNDFNPERVEKFGSVDEAEGRGFVRLSAMEVDE